MVLLGRTGGLEGVDEEFEFIGAQVFLLSDLVQFLRERVHYHCQVFTGLLFCFSQLQI